MCIYIECLRHAYTYIHIHTYKHTYIHTTVHTVPRPAGAPTKIPLQATNDFIKRKLQNAKNMYQDAKNSNTKGNRGLPMYQSTKGVDLLSQVIYIYVAILHICSYHTYM